MSVLVVLPVKPFGIAKARLAPRLGPQARARLGKAVAARTAAVAAATGADVAIVTPDSAVARWASRLGHRVIREAAGSGLGLNGAAAAAVDAAAAEGRPWAVLHADLPLVTAGELGDALALAQTRPVIAPSFDGGTTLLTGQRGPFPFAYGPGSFHRHLRLIVPRATVVVTPGLAYDMDSPCDLDRALALPNGRWLAPYVPSGPG